MQSILDKIISEYKNLTPSQQKLAEYISHNLDEALLLNATQLANRVSVSEATITRFVTRLGFSGFSEFKREVGHNIIQGYSTTEKLTESAETFERSNSIFSEILRGDIENIRRLHSNISDDVFEKAVNKISSARSIYVLGLRTSHVLSLYLAFSLRFFLKSVNLIKPGIWDIPEQVLYSGSKDVLISISFRRYTREVVNIAEKIKGKGAYLIAVTNSRFSPIAQLSDLVLLVETKMHTYIESYTAPMSLMNALIAAIALRKKKQALPALKKLEREFEKFQTYVK